MHSLLTHGMVASALLLVACGEPAPIESVESLVANPERLRELRAQCRADRATVGEPQCNAVAEAMQRRFFGNRGPKYTPPASPPRGFWQEGSTAASIPASPTPLPSAPKE
ncbi:MAG TPA: EexN family lipoprotein [Reyranella sp.]|nr:EexN family lipoprotein [Reyranella sp.]